MSEDGGAERDRTADLLNAIQALSQLSYSPGSSEAARLGGWPGRVNGAILRALAGVAELADARDSKSRAQKA